MAEIPGLRLDVANLCKANGYNKDTIRNWQYECNWHVVFGLGGWPEEASKYSDRDTNNNIISYSVNNIRKFDADPWSSATTYAVGNVVKNNSNLYRCILAHSNQLPTNTTYWTQIATGADGGVYKCILAHSNQPPNNSTYWTLVASSTVLAQNRYVTLFQKILTDQRYASLVTRYANGLKKNFGDICCWFDRISQLVSQNGTWAMMVDEADNDFSGGPNTNWRGKALSEFKSQLDAEG